MFATPPLGPPPRTVPLSLHLRVLLGGAFATIGFALLAFGGALSTAMVRNSELLADRKFDRELRATDGTVTAGENVGVRINSRNVIRLCFRYEVEHREYEGASYGDQQVPAPGSPVVVDYAADDPAVARIRGMRTAPLPAAIGFVMLLPAIGLAFVAVALVRNRRRVRLLQDGLATWGLLTDRRSTSTRINNQRVYRLQFTFVDADGAQRVAAARSHRAEFLDEEVARTVLYDRDSPRCCVLELLPGWPRFIDGAWAPAPTARVTALFALPALAVIGAVAASYITF